MERSQARNKAAPPRSRASFALIHSIANVRRHLRASASLTVSNPLYFAIIFVTAPAAVVTLSIGGLGFLGYLPYAAESLAFSFTRMLVAYLLSLGFALAYGYYAATRHSAERVMIPILDILQSVPILGFFPIAIVVLVNITGQSSAIGINLASVFLIFTSMAWNMVFGVYESLKTLPSDLREAADTFGLRGMERFRRVFLPATINRLVYNSILSWTAGWFFLVEAEIFTTNGTTSGGSPLVGIGSYLWQASSPLNGDAFLAGLILLVALIATMDLFVWRPLGRWAERFRYDQAPSGEGELIGGTGGGARFRRAAGYVTRGVRSGVTRMSTPFVTLAARTVGPTGSRRQPIVQFVARYAVIGLILVLSWLALIEIIAAAYNVFTAPIPPTILRQIESLPLAMGASASRVAIAYFACLAISLPLAILIARRPVAGRYGLPIVEVIASFPATALFPLIIFVLIPYISPNGAAVLMLATGMIWYLFFNILSGIRAIPPDLDEASRSFGLPRRAYYRRLVLPAIFPALITGSITAMGGGWNTLIVAEYLQGPGGEVFQLFGVGALLVIASTVETSPALLLATLFTLVVTVIAINELL